jgi:type II secretory pathway component HofQ
VQGTITLRLIDIPWPQALEAILSIYNLKRIDEGSVIRIFPRGKSS